MEQDFFPVGTHIVGFLLVFQFDTYVNLVFLLLHRYIFHNTIILCYFFWFVITITQFIVFYP